MKWAGLLALVASPLCADDVSRLQACFDEDQYCANLIVDDCMAENNDPAVVPEQCWIREHQAWQVILDRAYSKVLQETFSAPKPVTKLIRTEQEAWTVYRDLHCAVRSASNPQTYGSIRYGCLAQLTYERALDVSAQIGAEWAVE